MASIHSFVSDPVVSVKQIPLLIPVEAFAFLTINDHFCLLITYTNNRTLGYVYYVSFY